MSVALIVLAPEEYRHMYVPVAAQEVFDEIWMEGARRLRLAWVPLFRTGTSLRGGDFGDVLVELAALEAWVEASERSMDVRSSVARRIANLRRCLSRLLTEAGAEVDVFIG